MQIVVNSLPIFISIHEWQTATIVRLFIVPPKLLSSLTFRDSIRMARCQLNDSIAHISHFNSSSILVENYFYCSIVLVAMIFLINQYHKFWLVCVRTAEHSHYNYTSFIGHRTVAQNILSICSIDNKFIIIISTLLPRIRNTTSLCVYVWVSELFLNRRTRNAYFIFIIIFHLVSRAFANKWRIACTHRSRIFTWFRWKKIFAIAILYYYWILDVETNKNSVGSTACGDTNFIATEENQCVNKCENQKYFRLWM